MIAVTLTTWTKRISGLHIILEDISNQTVKPDVVFINLSLDEFPNQYDDINNYLPKDLLDKVNGKIIWCVGNDKSFKKVTPCLSYLNDNDIIINMDDDLWLPNDIIESRLSDFTTHKCQNAITSNIINYKYVSKFGLEYYFGATSIFSKWMFNNWQKWYVSDLIATGHDDIINTYVVSLENNVRLLPCTKYSMQALNDACNITRLDDNPMRSHAFSFNDAETITINYLKNKHLIV